MKARACRKAEMRCFGLSDDDVPELLAALPPLKAVVKAQAGTEEAYLLSPFADATGGEECKCRSFFACSLASLTNGAVHRLGPVSV